MDLDLRLAADVAAGDEDASVGQERGGVGGAGDRHRAGGGELLGCGIEDLDAGEERPTRSIPAHDENPSVAQAHRLVSIARGSEASCRCEAIGGRIVELGARQRIADEAACDQHPSVVEDGRRVVDARARHGGSGNEASRRRVVELGGGVIVSGIVEAAGNEDAAIVEQDGRVHGSRNAQRRDRNDIGGAIDARCSAATGEQGRGCRNGARGGQGRGTAREDGRADVLHPRRTLAGAER